MMTPKGLKDFMNHKKDIAILGSTSHIAKGLINNFLESEKFSLHLFSRSRGGYGDFSKKNYDAVINCVGTGASNKLNGDYSQYFTVTEEYDNLVIKHLRDKCPEALYISFSSGAIYGREFKSGAKENTANNIKINHVAPEEYYSIARLNAEAKHRSFKNLKIVDLRLFSYFSRFIDLTDNYFMVELINCILNKKIFITDDVNIVRDYVHPKDLFSAVKKCISAGKINAAFDARSAKPVSKKEILDYFSREYGLEYKTDKLLNYKSGTGFKNNYYSNYNNAISLGYEPVFSSMDAIKEESRYIIQKNVK